MTTISSSLHYTTAVYNSTTQYCFYYVLILTNKHGATRVSSRYQVKLNQNGSFLPVKSRPAKAEKK
jgi:hypothetical protein